ncbi:O-antigen export system, permease protein [hydrothermal vent metagenome]|uniref:O-antigen export system, permease protein n=1 Tax=hydrothermal vent metagenome TaxID=652676 RepID=A0A3B1D8V3_9ZZZZ
MSTIDTSMIAPESNSAQQHTRIEPQRGWIGVNVGEIWRYRDLLFLLVWRDFTSRYRQSVIGVGWALIRPMISMIVFTIVFGRMAKLPSDGIPYPIFNYTALLPWMFFSSCFTGSSNSLVSGGSLITKVYFPRLILPLSKVVIGLVDLAIQFFFLAILMCWYGIVPTWGILCIPLFLLMSVITALSVGLWMTSLNVKYRDIGHMVPFMTSIWMWMTPIVYSSSIVSEKWKFLYAINPLVGVIDGFRWALLGSRTPDWSMMAVSLTVAMLAFVGGLLFFRRTESQIADYV